MLSILFYGTEGALSLPSFEAVAEAHRVIGLVTPRRRGRGLRARLGAWGRATGLRRGPLGTAARLRGIPHWLARSAGDPRVGNALGGGRPDLICVAGFPWILPPEVLALPALGALNVHGSLLPRHRGPLPLFWTYHADDRESGVTVHWVEPEVDAGPIAGQAAFPLARGLPVESLNRRIAHEGSALLRVVLDAVERGAAERVVQDERRATRAPYPGPGPHVDFATWPVERVWHFLAGLWPRHREPLHDEAGRALAYAGVAGFRETSETAPPGTVRRAGRGCLLHCRGGIVDLIGSKA